MTVPNISFADLKPQYPPISRRREVRMMCPEDRFMIWNHDFHTTRNAADTVVSPFNSTWSEAGHKLTYTGGTGISSALTLARCKVPHSQFTSEITIEAHGQHGTVYNDVGTGFAVTSAIDNDVPQHTLYAAFRNSSGTQGGLYLQYVHGGTPVFSSVVPFVPAAFPFKLRCSINHGGMGLSVVEGNIERLLVNLEIDYLHIDMESSDVCNRMRPMIYMQSDNAQASVVSSWQVRANGTLGNREHVYASYKDGRPLISPDGRAYMCSDDCHVSTADPALNVAVNGAYARSWAATRLFDPVTGRLGECTGRYVIDTGTRRYGLQEAKIVYDDDTGLYHGYFSRWNEGGTVTVCHVATPDNILHGYWIFDKFDVVTFGKVYPFNGTNSVYDSDIRVKNGRIYFSGTVTNLRNQRSSFCSWGTDWVNFPNNNFVYDGTSEGGGFADIGNNLYVMTGTGSTGVTFIEYLTGKVAGTLTMPVAGVYPLLTRIIPFVRNGKTNYIIISFSDEPTGGNPEAGEDYVSASGVRQSLAFGATDAISLGTFAGEQYAPRSNAIVPYASIPTTGLSFK